MNNTEIENKKEKKKKKRILIFILTVILILLATVICGGDYFGDDSKNKDDRKQDNQIVADDGKIIKDYEFDEKGKAVPVKAPNIGMSIKSAILGDSSGKSKMIIKNSGDINISPQVIFKDKVIYQSQELKPGEAVESDLMFGALSVGEHEFNVLAVYPGGTGLKLKSKVVVQKQ